MTLNTSSIRGSSGQVANRLPEYESRPQQLRMAEAVETLEKKMIEDDLNQTGGNQRKAAKALGITERILGYKIKTYTLKKK